MIEFVIGWIIGFGSAVFGAILYDLRGKA